VKINCGSSHSGKVQDAGKVAKGDKAKKAGTFTWLADELEKQKKAKPLDEETLKAIEWAEQQAQKAPTPDKAKEAEEAQKYQQRQQQIAEAYEAVQRNDAKHSQASAKRLKDAYIGDETGTRVPLSFKSKEQYQEFQADLAEVFDKHGISDATVQQVGSATTGYRGNPLKDFGEWKDTSDNDFAVFSGQALVQAHANNTPVNKKIIQGGRYTVFKNSAPKKSGFYKTPLGRDLDKLAKKWNKKIYGHEEGGLQPLKPGQKVAERDGFDFKLNTGVEPFASKPKGGAITVMGPKG
jgi:hypothetical protein